MTVAQMIEQLQQLDPTLELFSRDYEAGCNPVTHIRMFHVYEEPTYADSWYYGSHEETSSPEETKEKSAYKALFIS